MSWAYITYEFPFPQIFHKELIWADKNCHVYFAFKLNDTDEWSFYSGNASNELDTGRLLTSYGTSEYDAQWNNLNVVIDTDGKFLAVLPIPVQAKYARLYVLAGEDVIIHEWHPSIHFTAHEIITGTLEITDELSDAPLIKVVSSSIDRLKIGNINTPSTPYFGIAGYDVLGNKIFELSDNEYSIAGWYFDKDKLYNSTGLLIDSSTGRIELGGINIDSVDKSIETTDYVSGPLGKGWRIDTEKAEFQNIYARGKLSCVVFEKDVLSSVGGKVFITNSDLLDKDMSSSGTPNLCTSWTNLSYDTFASTGGNIDSAITAAGNDYAYSVLSLISGHTYIVDINLILSGQSPRVSTGILSGDGGGAYDLPQTHLINGSNTLKFDYTGTGNYLWIGNDPGEESNYSAVCYVCEEALLTIKNDTTFADDEILQISDGVDDEYLRVVITTDAPEYTVIRDLASSYPAGKPLWKTGTAVVSRSAIGGGHIVLDASTPDMNPVIQIFKRTSNEWGGVQELLRIGNLYSFLGYTSQLFGIAIGDDTGYFKYDATNGVRVKGVIDASSITSSTITGSLFRTASSGRRIEISEDGIACITGATIGKYGSFKYSAAKYGAGIQVWINNPDLDIPIYELSAGVKASIHLSNRASNPTGAATIGDLAVISTNLSICQADGSPSTAWYPMYPVRGTPVSGQVVRWGSGFAYWG